MCVCDLIALRGGERRESIDRAERKPIDQPPIDVVSLLLQPASAAAAVAADRSTAVVAATIDSLVGWR